MPRRREVPKRPMMPDPKYGDKLVTRFVNSLMVAGKKSTAESILYGALDILEERSKGENPVEIFRKAVETPSRLSRSRAVA